MCTMLHLVTPTLTYFHAFEYLYDYFKEAPLVETANITKIKFFDNFEEFSRYTTQQIHRCSNESADRNIIRQCNAKVEYAQKLCKLYEFASFFKARFDTSNTQKLTEEMSRNEQLSFEVDVRNIDWKKYFIESHIPGLIKYVMNSTGATSTTTT